MKIDLHIHTKYSDGEFVLHQDALALFSDYELISFADHEHIFDPMQFNHYNSRKFISGVELSCNHKGQNIEILGYNFDPHNVELNSIVNKIRGLRISFIRWIFEKNSIEVKDFPFNPFRINTSLPEWIDKREFWQRYNVEYKSICHSISAQDVIEAIVSAGGIPVLAHPLESLVGSNENELEQFIKSLDVRTIELITPKHCSKDIRVVKNIIERNKLQASIGSDSHKTTLTRISHEYNINDDAYKWIKKLIQQ